MDRAVTARSIKTSSYKDAFFYPFFFGFVSGLRPDRCVELGTYAGFSAFCVASALKQNGNGQLDCYDLWEDYKFNHVSKKTAEDNLKGLPVTLTQEDVFKVFSHYLFHSVDLLIVDVSNDGRIYRDILETWKDKLSKNGVVIFEGGIKERDEVEWMVKYKKVPIRNILNDKFINTNYTFQIIDVFPGLTIFKKR